MLSALAKYALFSCAFALCISVAFSSVLLNEQSYESALKESGASDPALFLPLFLENAQDIPEGFNVTFMAQETAKQLRPGWLLEQQMSVIRGVLAFMRGDELRAQISLSELRVALANAFAKEYERSTGTTLSQEQLEALSAQFLSDMPANIYLTEEDFPLPMLKGSARAAENSRIILVLVFVAAFAYVVFSLGARNGLREAAKRMIFAAIFAAVIALAVWYLAPHVLEKAPHLLELFAGALAERVAMAIAFCAAGCALAAGLAYAASFAFKESPPKGEPLAAAKK